VAGDQTYDLLPHDLTLITRVRVFPESTAFVRAGVHAHCVGALLSSELLGSGAADDDRSGEPGVEAAQQEEGRLDVHQEEVPGASLSSSSSA
jgi:hypothetical protein